MKVQIDKSYPVGASAEVAWGLLQDIEAVAACMPGAKITERVDERHFKGTVAVRFGPASMSFRGELEVKDLDASARMLHLVGKGTDSTGSSGATMDLTARVEAADAGASRLVGASEVSMSGKAAAFGARLASGVADQVLQQFAGNFAARAAERASSLAPAGAAPSGAQSAPPAAELNGLALLWALIRGWLRSLIGKRTA